MITAERIGQMDANCCGDRFSKDVKGGNTQLSQLCVWLLVFVCALTYSYSKVHTPSVSLVSCLTEVYFRFWKRAYSCLYKWSYPLTFDLSSD